MADLNEPKKETERIALPAPVEAKPPSAAPRPLPSKEEVAAGPRPPARPTTHPSAPAASGAARPPNGLPLPTGAKASVTPQLGLIPPSPPPVTLSSGAPGTSKSGLSPISRPLENRDLIQAGQRQATARVADSPLKGAAKHGSVPLAPIIRAAAPAVANSSAKGLGALAPAQLCWALLGISVLTLLMQLWNYFS
jgi:hypothetical protein